MKRLYEAAAYGPSRPFWAGTVGPADWPEVRGAQHVDTAVIGGGFTGLNCALALAQAGVEVAVFDAEAPGWGASGRNGGFCCLGGAILPEAAMARRYGTQAVAEWQATQRASIDHVAGLLDDWGLDADRHSDGETVLAHSPRAFRRLQAEAADVARDHGCATELLGPDDLRAQGMAGPWQGGLTIRRGFALNPAQYCARLAQAAEDAGAQVFARSAVTGLARGAHWTLTVNGQPVTARRVVIATNGYSSEDLPDWLRGRTLPAQSSVIVTRVLSDAERAAAGWTSAQMAYDTRRLLHYFRLLPDGRFLFGMRGGLTARASEQAAISARIRRDFHAAFPAWSGVDIDSEWSGLVCLMARGHPFMGAVPGFDGLFAALGFHGNGVAMGSFLGHALGREIASGKRTAPEFLARAPGRFPLGRYRRMLLRPAYWAAETFDL